MNLWDVFVINDYYSSQHAQIIAQELARPPFLSPLARARWLDMGSRRIQFNQHEFPQQIVSKLPSSSGGVEMTHNETSLQNPTVTTIQHPSAPISEGASASTVVDFSLQQRLDNLRRIHQDQILSSGGSVSAHESVASHGLSQGHGHYPLRNLNNTLQSHSNIVSQTQIKHTNVPNMSVQTFVVGSNIEFECSNFPLLGSVWQPHAVNGSIDTRMIDIGAAEEFYCSMPIGY